MFFLELLIEQTGVICYQSSSTCMLVHIELIPSSNVVMQEIIFYERRQLVFDQYQYHLHHPESSPVPVMANLLWYYYGKKWLLQTKKLDIRKALVFSFIDDLCTFNNDEFENNYNDLYPDELELKKENEDSYKASVLDLSI